MLKSLHGSAKVVILRKKTGLPADLLDNPLYIKWRQLSYLRASFASIVSVA